MDPLLRQLTPPALWRHRTFLMVQIYRQKEIPLTARERLQKPFQQIGARLLFSACCSAEHRESTRNKFKCWASSREKLPPRKTKEKSSSAFGSAVSKRLVCSMTTDSLFRIFGCEIFRSFFSRRVQLCRLLRVDWPGRGAERNKRQPKEEAVDGWPTGPFITADGHCHKRRSDTKSTTRLAGPCPNEMLLQ